MVASFNTLARPLGRAFWPNQNFFPSLNCCGKVSRKRGVFVRCFSVSQEHVVKSSHSPIEVPEVPFHEYVFEGMGQWENKIAVECVFSHKKISYGELYKRSKTLASSLQKKFNMKKGDCLSVVLANCPEYPLIILAGSRTGVVCSTVNPLYTPTEISMQFKITRPKLVITVIETYERCSEALQKLQVDIPIIVVKQLPNDVVPPGAVDFSELIESSTPVEYDPVRIDPNDDLVIPFSSGTSGLPKGVQLAHRNIIANLCQLKYSAAYLKSFPNKETNQTVSLAILPMFHIYGMGCVTFDGLRSGNLLVSMPKFEPQMFAETLLTKKIQVTYLVPPLIFFLMNHPGIKEKHLEHVQYVVNGAAPCGVSDIAAFTKKFPSTKLTQGYGLTETSPVVTISHSERLHKVGSVGHPLGSTLIRISDLETGKSLPPGSTGEIYVKGPQVMKGYLDQPEITKNSFDGDGWFKTGDIGHYDEDNDLYIVDRIKELIKVKGFQVAPAEIEEFLRSHPKINDAGVIGVPYEGRGEGEVPRAFVVLKKGVSMTDREVMEFVETNLTSFKRLEGGVRFVKAIPKSSAGKILRRELKKLD